MDYSHNSMTPKRAAELEASVAAWLVKEKPGSFSSRDAVGMYKKAFAQFHQYSGWEGLLDTFETALAVCGFRAGCCTYKGHTVWLLILPSSVDTALGRMAAAEDHAIRETA